MSPHIRSLESEPANDLLAEVTNAGGLWAWQHHDPVRWIVSNRVLRGRPFSLTRFGRRPYLPEYLQDMSPDKDTIKSRQMEISEAELNHNLRLVSMVPHSVVMHVFPTSKLAVRFGRERLNPSIKESPALSRRLMSARESGGADNVQMKQFAGTSFYVLEASWTEYGGRSPSCDSITFDEYDAANPRAEQVFAESTSHSEIGHKHRISTPTLPKIGIHGRFLGGTQHTWHYKCHCGHESEIAWPDSVLEVPAGKDPEFYGAKPGDQHYYGCQKCGAPLDRGVHLDETGGQYGGHWIALNPKAPPGRSSWKITQLMAPWITAERLYQKRQDYRFPHQWANEALGEPFLSDEVTVTDEDLWACCREEYDWVDGSRGPWTHGPIAMGVDWGDVSWITIRSPYQGRSRLLWVEKITAADPAEHTKRVGDLFAAYCRNGDGILVCDAGYGKDRNAILFKRFPGSVYACYYPREERSSKVFRPAWQPAQSKVTVHRTATIKLVLSEFLQRQIDLPYRSERLGEFVDHHVNFQVLQYEDPKSGEIYETVRSLGPDHYGHSNLYAMIAEERLTGVVKRSLVLA